MRRRPLVTWTTTLKGWIFQPFLFVHLQSEKFLLLELVSVLKTHFQPPLSNLILINARLESRKVLVSKGIPRF